MSHSVVAVVGASGALGSLIATEVAARGGSVILVGRDRSRLEAVEIAERSIVVGDLGDASTGEDLARVAEEAHGRLDGVINAAGVVAFGSLMETDDAVIEELFLTNVLGPLWLLRRTVPLLSESSGFVAQLSAVVAEQPLPGMAAYSATKAALTAANRALVRELRRSKVSVYDIRPPHTETGLANRPLAGSAPKLGQGLEPGRVAHAVVAAIEEGRLDVSAEDVVALSR